MEIETSEKEKGILLTIKGRMDALTAPEFEKHCRDLADPGPTLIAADLSAVDYISSAGLRAILASAKMLRSKGGDLSFCGVSGMVKEVFGISGFENLFTLAADSDELLR